MLKTCACTKLRHDEGVDMKRFSRAALFGFFSGFALLFAQAADEKPKENEKLPSAKEVLEKYTKAIGGKEAFSKHNSQHVLGKVEMPAQNMSGKMEVFAARPNKLM